MMTIAQGIAESSSCSSNERRLHGESVANSSDERSNSRNSLLALVTFSDDYNIHEFPPTPDEQPLRVDFQINLRNLLEVDEVSQLCSLEITLRMYWTDPRVTMVQPMGHGPTPQEYVTLNPRAAETFWIPDIFIDQAKELRVPTYYVRPSSIRVYNDSRIRFATRVNFDVACGMDFHKYPHDQQLCEIKFESFGYTNEQMKYVWLEGGIRVLSLIALVHAQATGVLVALKTLPSELSPGNNVNENISLPQFDFEVKLGDNYSTDYYDLAYPGVIMRVLLTRKMSFHLMQTYVPSFIFVTLAWLTVFIPPDQVPGRVTMTMTTLLTLTAMFAAVRSNVPRVSYVSYLDIWMFVCIVFVFSAIIHFIVVIALLRQGRKGWANHVEQGGTLMIPVAFLVFNLVYWSKLYE
eukprot:maker-scaffold981_size73921-snap-gene-0.17 protein:Tk09947 transcript:maker-scaffold981_size73921-snap-gene-0.17-mRNA-1 annotation:"glycine receptor subunit alpha-4-like isoform x8"